MATLRKDMQVIVLNFEKRINMLEENRHSAKEDLDGAKARIEMLEAEIEKRLCRQMTAGPQPR